MFDKVYFYHMVICIQLTAKFTKYIVQFEVALQSCTSPEKAQRSHVNC